MRLRIAGASSRLTPAATLAVALVSALAGCDAYLGPVTETTPDAVARSYVNAALDVMQANSINRRTIDWPRFRADALALIAGKPAPEDVYAALATTVGRLGDSRGSFTAPANAAPPGAPGSGGRASGGMLDARIAYVDVPGFTGTNPIGRVDSTQAIIRALDTTHGPCGWVVDLRQSAGGNMYPVIVGLGPLFGSAVLGGFVDADDRRQTWEYRAGAGVVTEANGRETTVMRATTPYTLRRPASPVAVLHGALTSGSGEAAAISFRGRAGARSFGAPTAGQSAASTAFQLRDGAILNLTVAVMVDRAGQRFGGRVGPDQAVASPSPVASGVVDEAVRQAMTWLAAQPACVSAS